MAGINAATGQTFSSVDDILKNFYLGPVREQLNYSSVLMYRVQRDEESVNGRQVVIPLHTGRNEGISGVVDGGKLPDPGEQTWTQTTFPVQYLYGRLLITGPTISAAKNDKGSFIRTLDAAIKGLTRDFKKNTNRILHGDGSGSLAQLTTPAASTVSTFTVADTWDTDAAAATRFLYPGMKIAIAQTDLSDLTSVANRNASTVLGGNTISSVDASANTVTFDTAITTGSDAGWTASKTFRMFRAAQLSSSIATTAALSSAWKEPMGLMGVVDDASPWGRGVAGSVTGQYAGYFQNINPAGTGNDYWQSYMKTNTTLTFSDLQQMLDGIAINSEGLLPTLIMTDYVQRRKYFELWGSNPGSGSTVDVAHPGFRRYTNTMTLDGGFQALEYNGIPLVCEVDATPGHMFFVHEPSLAVFRNEDYFWLDRDGKVLHRLEDKDAYQATLACYFEFGTYRRNAHGCMNALGE